MVLDQSMTIQQLFNIYQPKLRSAGINTARLDTLVLLEDCLGKERGWLLAHPEIEVSEKDVKKINSQISLRINHLPLSYIRNKIEFYNREFYIDNRAFEPRSESEAMIDILKSISLDEDTRIADVGTGTGAIGITAALEFPNAVVELLEISLKTIQVAKKNVHKHGLDLPIIRSNLLSGSNNKYDIVLANLPYVPTNHPINEAAKKEPTRAIFGGLYGLDLYEKLWQQIFNRSHVPRYVLTESLIHQHSKLSNLAKSHQYEPVQVNGLVQCFEKINL